MEDGRLSPTFGRRLFGRRWGRLFVSLCTPLVFGEIEVAGIPLDRIEQVFELASALGLGCGCRQLFMRSGRDGGRFRLDGLDRLSQRLGRPFEMPDRFEIARVALARVEKPAKRVPN